jgi:ankyrin repeat protein
MFFIREFIIVMAMIAVFAGCASTGETLLQKPARLHDKSSFDKLLAAGADIDQRGYEGATLLYSFAFEGDDDFVEFLLNRGADPTRGASWKGYDTALHKAAERGHTKIITLLLDHKVDPNIRNSAGHTPLMKAAWASKLSAVEALYQRGGDINAADKQGLRAIFHVDGPINHSEEDYLRVLRFLVSRGVQLNVTDESGNTPLRYAILHNEASLLRYYLSIGIDPNLRNKKGISAVDYAQQLKRERISEILNNAQ